MAIASDTLVADYEQATGGCALLDNSERGKLALTGAGAAEFLNGQVSNDIVSLTPGSGCYAAVLTHKGKMVADVRVLAAADGSQLLLDTERSALQTVFDTLRLHRIGFDTELHKRTLQRGLLSLIGPRAVQVALQACPGAVLADAEHANGPAQIDGHDILLIRTDTGVDVLCVTEDLDAVHVALSAAGAVSIGADAAEIVRVERGRPRYGVDLDDSVIPQEAGLNERAVSFTKGCYVGQETVARLFYRGKPNRHLRGLRLSGEVATGDELRHDDRVVGALRSVVASPRLGPIGLALVRREAQPGSELAAGERGGRAVVVELPFEAA